MRAEQSPIRSGLLNTLVIAGPITLFYRLFDGLAGYAFAKRRLPGRNLLFWLVLSTLTVPAQVTLIPVCFILKELGLLDSYSGVILPGLADVFGVFARAGGAGDLHQGVCWSWRPDPAALRPTGRAASRAAPRSRRGAGRSARSG